MVLRYITGTNLAAFPGEITPSNGYKWKVLQVAGQLVSSSTTGTRQLSLGLNAALPTSMNIEICTTGSQTGVSTTYYMSASGVNTTDANGGTMQDVWVSSLHGLFLYGSLVSGDTISYVILVDEVIDD